jgi:hypothetical protein
MSGAERRVVDWKTLVMEAEKTDVESEPQVAYEFSQRTFKQRPADDYPDTDD